MSNLRFPADVTCTWSIRLNNSSRTLRALPEFRRVSPSRVRGVHEQKLNECVKSRGVRVWYSLQ